LTIRQNLRRALSPQDPSRVTDGELSSFKLDVISNLAKFRHRRAARPGSFGGAGDRHRLPSRSGIGLVVALESTGYNGIPTARQSQVLPDWSVQKAKRMGASMVKLLVYYHPQSPTAAEIEDFVRLISEECSRFDLGLMLEPLSYSLEEGTSLSSAEKRYVVTETARRLVVSGAWTSLRVSFPLDVHSGAEDEKILGGRLGRDLFGQSGPLDLALGGGGLRILFAPGAGGLSGGSRRNCRGKGRLAASGWVERLRAQRLPSCQCS
jgi:tagatose-1,6-bisphosphate aldolase